MKTNKQISEWLQLSLDSYTECPSSTPYEEGFKAALKEALNYVDEI